jgi:predicted NACHT family NTPase
VEVADFDDEQIAIFVNNWFREKDPSKAERLLEKLQGNEPVKELARTPLLLTLLCLVFGERNDFPPKRSELYKEGLEVLMKKWDAKRNIEREQIYKHLSPQNKEDMLGQIAFNTFVNGEYFFRQEDLQRQIKDYICNLPEVSADPEALRFDSEVVLKAIEHHHGLLVERARNIYSFSHLTFQEYFTAREIERERHLEILVQNITNSRWREVFYLTAEMLRQSDNLLRLMKSRIDGMLSSDEKLQAFLEWANKKIGSIQFRHKTIAFISFYAYVEFYDYDFAFDFACDYGQDFIIEDIDRILVQVLYDINLSSVNDNIDLAISLARDIRDDILQKALQALEVKLTDNGEEISQWWENHGENWISELRQVCIDHRNIGHDWQFTEEQVELLEQYYPANLLLVECMNRSNVSKEVREEIESTLLLPVGAIGN